MTDPFKIEITQEVIIDSICEIGRVTGRLDQEGKEPLYQVEAYSVLESNRVNNGQIEGWYKYEELTV